MVTPAILVSARGVLVLTTSQRLSRSLERVRAVAAAPKPLRAAAAGAPPDAGEHGYFTQQLGFSARRARLLQRALASLYGALDIFVASIKALAAA